MKGIDQVPADRELRGHRRAVALTALATVVMAVAGAAYLHSSLVAQHGLAASSTRVGQSPVSEAPALPDLSSQRSTGLIRADPTGVLIKRYAGLNGQKPLGLVASMQTNDQAVIHWVVYTLNALPVFRWTVWCPMDDGSYFSIVLSYVDGSVTPVRVGETGCQQVSVGGSDPIELWAVKSPDLIDNLRALVARGSGGRG